MNALHPLISAYSGKMLELQRNLLQRIFSPASNSRSAQFLFNRATPQKSSVPIGVHAPGYRKMLAWNA